MTSEATEIKAGVDMARVRAAVGPVLSAHGLVLVDVEWLTDSMGWLLRVTIEREGSTLDTGGVTLEDCADVSRDASAALDVDDFIPHQYHLEVSSPGLDRPLRTESEFARFAGKTAKVKLTRPAPDGQRVLRGTLDAAPAGAVAVFVDGKRIEVPFVDVAEANLVFELNAQPKKQPAAKRAGRGAPARAAQGAKPKSPRRPASTRSSS